MYVGVQWAKNCCFVIHFKLVREAEGLFITTGSKLKMFMLMLAPSLLPTNIPKKKKSPMPRTQGKREPKTQKAQSQPATLHNEPKLVKAQRRSNELTESECLPLWMANMCNCWISRWPECAFSESMSNARRIGWNSEMHAPSRRAKTSPWADLCDKSRDHKLQTSSAK